jgi:hypothetical protein
MWGLRSKLVPVGLMSLVTTAPFVGYNVVCCGAFKARGNSINCCGNQQEKNPLGETNAKDTSTDL